MKKTAIKISLITSMILVAGSFAAIGAFAQKPSDNNRPGWGFGDKNHHHVGPPGISVSVNMDRDDDGDRDLPRLHTVVHRNDSGKQTINLSGLNLWLSRLQSFLARFNNA